MKTNNGKLILWGAIIVIIILLLLLRSWWTPKLIVGLGGYLNQEIVSDTTIVVKKGNIDTLDVFNDYVKRKGIILNPKAKIVYREIIKENPIQDEGGAVTDSLKYFDVLIDDDFIKGKMNIYNTFNGDLFGADLEYQSKVVMQTDTVYTTITNTIKLDNNIPKPEIGLGVGVSTLMVPHVAVTYETKKNLQFIYNYNHVVDKNSLQLNSKYIKNYHSLTLIKKW